MTDYAKKLGGYEKHHEPSLNGGLVSRLIGSKTFSTTKLDLPNAPFVGVFSYPKKKISRKFLYYIPIIFQKIGYIVFSILHGLFVGIKIEGRENLSGLNGPIILASNHTSEFDVTAMPLIFPFFSKFFPIYYITNPKEKYKDKNYYGWRRFIYGGLFFNILGGYPVYSGHRDYETSLSNHVELLNKGRTICIFPEGRMTLDGKMSNARGGLGYLVYTTGATVVPVAIDTFFNASWKRYFSFRQKVTMTICKPVFKEEIMTTQNPTVLDYRAGSQKVLDKIAEILEK